MIVHFCGPTFFLIAPMSIKPKTSIIVTYIVIEHGRKEKKCKRWCKNWLLQRNTYSHIYLFRELRSNEPKDFYNYMRMDETIFQSLLEMIRHKITKQDTHKAISNS